MLTIILIVLFYVKHMCSVYEDLGRFNMSDTKEKLQFCPRY